MKRAQKSIGLPFLGEGTRRRSAVFLAAMMIAGLTSVLCNQRPGTEGRDQPALLGKRAPEFALRDLSGKTVRLSHFKGKVLLLDFWATWCRSCQKEIPELILLQKRYADEGFTVVGVSLDEEGATVVKPFTHRFGITYPILIGNTHVAASYGGIQAVPMAFLIGRNGRILKTFVGAQKESDFERAIRSALREKRPSRVPPSR